MFTLIKKQGVLKAQDGDGNMYSIDETLFPYPKEKYPVEFVYDEMGFIKFFYNPIYPNINAILHIIKSKRNVNARIKLKYNGRKYIINLLYDNSIYSIIEQLTLLEDLIKDNAIIENGTIESNDTTIYEFDDKECVWKMQGTYDVIFSDFENSVKLFRGNVSSCIEYVINYSMVHKDGEGSLFVLDNNNRVIYHKEIVWKK